MIWNFYCSINTSPIVIKILFVRHHKVTFLNATDVKRNFNKSLVFLHHKYMHGIVTYLTLWLNKNIHLRYIHEWHNTVYTFYKLCLLWSFCLCLYSSLIRDDFTVEDFTTVKHPHPRNLIDKNWIPLTYPYFHHSHVIFLDLRQRLVSR